MNRGNRRSSPALPRDHLNEQIRVLREFYQRGRQSLKQHSKYESLYGLFAQATADGQSGELLRKARVFADEETGYTREELDDLIGHCRKAGYVLGISHVIRLLSIRRGRQRNALQRAAINGHWTRRRIDAEISRRYGNRAENRVGRKIKQPQDMNEALHRVAQLCGHWQRLFASLTEDMTVGMSVPIREHIRTALQGVCGLAKAIQTTQTPS